MSKLWTRDGSLIALQVYCALPFGQLHQSNPAIVRVAHALNRTPSAVAMKACNLASLDDSIPQKGLNSVSALDRSVWAEFQSDSSAIAAEAAALYEKIVNNDESITGAQSIGEFAMPKGATEMVREVRVRQIQSFFRTAVLTSYESRCAVSGLQLPEALNASHIIPWSENDKRRADPTNGIALNALYDRLFDRGLIGFDKDYKVLVADKLRTHFDDSLQAKQLLDIEGREMILPRRFLPDRAALQSHCAKHGLVD